MNYSPDYSMLRRNQDCGCRRPGKEPDSCGCSNRREPQRPGRRMRPMAAPASAQTAPFSAPDAQASTGSSGSPPGGHGLRPLADLAVPSQALMVGTIFQELDYP